MGWYIPEHRRTAHSGGKDSEMVADWASAKEYMEHGRDPDDRPIANNTRCQRIKRWCGNEGCDTLRGMGFEGECFAIKLHATNVVVYHFDGAYQLNTGGWYTVTTKARMDAFTPRWLSVGSHRRYIPIAEREERILERRPGLKDQPEVLREEARERDEYESFWCVWLRFGYIPWEDREEDGPHWHYNERIRFEDGMVIYRPDLSEPFHGGLDTSVEVEHKLGGTARAGAW